MDGLFTLQRDGFQGPPHPLFTPLTPLLFEDPADRWREHTVIHRSYTYTVLCSYLAIQLAWLLIYIHILDYTVSTICIIIVSRAGHTRHLWRHSDTVFFTVTLLLKIVSKLHFGSQGEQQYRILAWAQKPYNVVTLGHCRRSSFNTFGCSLYLHLRRMGKE